MSNPTETNTSGVADFVAAMETIAPVALAQEWDNVGLLAGDPSADAHRVLCCIDLTPAVVDEAIEQRTDLVMAYHPPIFRPINKLHADSRNTDAAVYRCIRNGIAIYSTHTALDAADGGTNDVMATLCGIKKTEPLEYVDEPGGRSFKLVVFAQPSQVDAIADAMFAAGAGHIGDYSHCSYRSAGYGTFLGGSTTQPVVGQPGRVERIKETRLESIVPADALPAVLAAMIKANPYDEPAYDIYPLEAKPVRGIGRVGRLPRRCATSTLAQKLQRQTGAHNVQIVGDAGQTVDTAIIVVGAAGSLPFRRSLTSNDVVITGEIRHHDALSIQRSGCTAIALGHWASERPALRPLSSKLEVLLPEVKVSVSNADRDPFVAA